MLFRGRNGDKKEFKDREEKRYYGFRELQRVEE